MALTWRMRVGNTAVTRLTVAALSAVLLAGAPSTATAGSGSSLESRGFVPEGSTGVSPPTPRDRAAHAPFSLGLSAPTGWLARCFPRGTDQTVSRVRGRQVLEFPVDEQALGLFLDVKGEVEFERVVIGFADGEVRQVDAFGLQRADGLFELTRFDRMRAVESVHVVLLARSRTARLGLRLGV